MSKNPPPGLCREELAASRSELSESNISCIPPDEALLGKVKSTMSDIVASFEASGTSTSFSVDDHIAATERHLNALKQLKMDRTASAGCSTPNAAFGTPPPASLSSPNSRPSTYIAAVLRPKKVSPKRSPFITRGEVEAARHTSALRSEERQRRAEERRLDYLQELKMKSSAADARVMQVKARREMAEQQRIIAQDRLQNGIRRAQEVLQQTKERAQHAHSHIDEVRLTNELRQQTKALLLDKKMNEVVHNREQKLEERQRLAQERKDAIMAAAERRRNLSQERLEKQQQREQQRQENIRRMEDQKRQDQEQKQRKADEWEKKVLQHYEDANAEAEALCQKTEMKFSKSAELLNKRRVMQQKKVQLQDQKFREAQQRRNGELDSKPAYQELLPPGTAIEEEQLSQRMSKTVAAAQRQGRIYCETYQKDCLRSVKDLNRCRLRLIFSRLATSLSGSGSVAQSIHALNEIKASSLTELDMEYLRYFNSYEVIVKAITESRKLRELTLFRQSAGLLRSLFSDSAEGRTNILHFSRCGNIVPLVQCLREELKTLKQHSNSDILRLLLFLIGKCLEGICAEASTNGSLQSTRDQVLSDLESFGMDRLCQVVVKLCTSEEDLELAHSALCVIHAQISVYARRKTEVKSSWFTSVSTSLFTLLQNVVTPDTGSPLREDAKSMSCGRVTVLFCVLRVLNMLARWQLGALQELLHDGGNAVPEKEVQQTANAALSRMELFHVFSCYFSYIAGHIGHLEAIDSSEPAEASSPSFVEAMRFGITLSSFPSYPMYATEQVDAYEPGGPRYPLRSSLHECLLLIGYLSLDDRLLQEMLSWGTEKTLLGTIISTLPIHYFTKGRHILFPTFVCALTESYKNNLVARHEMDLRQLLTFVEDEYNLLSKKAKSFALEHASQLKSHKARTDPQHFSLMSSVGKSWADMTDDEEEQSETAPVADAPTTTPSTEKERLCKSLKTVAGSGNDVFYRVERRIPVAYWPGVIAQLQQTLKSTAH